MTLPDPIAAVLVPPDYAPGVHVEREEDPAAMEVRLRVSLGVGRQVVLSSESLMRASGPEVVMRSGIDKAVRQMQDEAVAALGLEHWRAEVEREVRAEMQERYRRQMSTLVGDVRNAANVDAALVMVYDAREVLL